MYETKKGDNLSTIAKSNNTTVQSLIKANQNIANPNLIKIGQKINIGSQTPIAQQVTSNIQSNVPNTVNAQAIDNVSPIKVPVVPQSTPTTIQTAKDTVSTLPQKESVQQSNDNVVRSLYQRGITDPNQIIDVINYDQNGNKVSNLTLDDVFRVTDTIKVDTAKSKSEELLKAIGSNSQNNELNLIDLRSEYNVDTKKQELSNIQKKIADRTAQYEKAFIDTEGQVIPIEDIQGQKALVKRQMESEMAAYSAKAQVLQNDLASAENTVKDFMQARSADTKDYSDRLKILYSDAKDTLNESQKRIIERATKEADRKYAGDQKNLDFITEQALLAQKNGAPADLVAKVMQSKTRDEASNLVGKFSRDPLEIALKQSEIKYKNAQMQKLYNDISESKAKQFIELSNAGKMSSESLKEITKSDQYKTINATIPAINALKEYRDTVQKYGTFEAFGKGSGEKNAAYGNALAAWKTLAGLGALSGADFALAENVVPKGGALFIKNSTQISQLNKAIDNAVNQAGLITNRLTDLYPDAKNILSKQFNDIKISSSPETLSNQDLYNMVEPKTNNNSNFFNK